MDNNDLEKEILNSEYAYEQSLGDKWFWNETYYDGIEGEYVHSICSTDRVQEAYVAGYKKCLETLKSKELEYLKSLHEMAKRHADSIIPAVYYTYVKTDVIDAYEKGFNDFIDKKE